MRDMLSLHDPMEPVRALQMEKMRAELPMIGKKEELGAAKERREAEMHPFKLEEAKERMFAAQNKPHNQPKSWQK